MAGAQVSLLDVTKSYRLGDGSRLVAADDVTLDIASGQSVALVGPSGSGKSTLLHLIGAVDVPDAGTITVDGQRITGLGRRALADYRAGVGFVFQHFHLLPALTLLDNVCAPLVGRPYEGDKRARGRELLEAVGLGARASSFPGQLSGGQQQRVALARALVARPKLLLADEPTGNLDSSTAAEILELIAELHEQLGMTVVIATHDTGVARTCARVLRIVDGRAREDAAENTADVSHSTARRAWVD